MLTARIVRWLSIAALLTGLASAQTVVFSPSTTNLDPGGGSLTVTASITYATPPSQLAFTTNLPAGWAYASGTNDPLLIQPSPGTTGELSWLYITTPTSPATFSFTATYPASLAGLQPLSTSTITRATTESTPVTMPGPGVTLAASPVPGLWLGGTGTWTDPAQWSGGVVPNNAGNAVYTVEINAGAATLNSAVTLYELRFAGGTIGGSGILTLVGAPPTWNGGVFSALNQLQIASGAMFTAATAANHDFPGTTILNQGQFIWQNNGALRSGSGGIFINAAGATFIDASSGASPILMASTGGAFTFSNLGSYLKSNSSETKISAAFSNQGNIAVNAGNLHFDSTFTQGGGTLFIASGATAQFDLPLILGAGALTGGGALAGNVSNAAFMSPGSILGTLTVQGNLNLLSTSQLWFDIGGTTQGTTYDFLNVSGSATLGGTLTLNLVNDAAGTLLPSDNLILLSATSLTGAFANVANGGRLTTTNGVNSFQVNYAGTSLTLSNFVAVPEPTTWALLLAGLGVAAVGTWRCRGRL